MSVIGSILSFVIMLTITFLVYMFSKKYIFSKLNINKWIPLSISLILIILQYIIGITNPYISMGYSMLPIIFFLWFMDIQNGRNIKTTGKKIIIKPKAKPNRVKNK